MINASAIPRRGPTAGERASWRAPTLGGGKPRLLVLEVHSPSALDAAPVAHLLTEREEHYEYDDQGNVSYASIRIWYERLERARLFSRGPRPNLCFEGSYRTSLAASGCVSLTTTQFGHGAVYLDLKGLAGHRIGTYLMNEIVSWTKQWPGAEVHPVKLLDGQANDSSNKARRNRFYTQFGLSFDFEDARERAGQSRDITVEQLNTVDTWRLNIREQPLDEALRDALAAAQNADDRLGSLAAEYERFRTANAQHRILWRRAIAVALVAFVLAVLTTASVLHRFDNRRSDHAKPPSFSSATSVDQPRALSA